MPPAYNQKGLDVRERFLAIFWLALPAALLHPYLIATFFQKFGYRVRRLPVLLNINHVINATNVY